MNLNLVIKVFLPKRPNRSVRKFDSITSMHLNLWETEENIMTWQKGRFWWQHCSRQPIERKPDHLRCKLRAQVYTMAAKHSSQPNLFKTWVTNGPWFDIVVTPLGQQLDTNGLNNRVKVQWKGLNWINSVNTTIQNNTNIATFFQISNYKALLFCLIS